MFKMDEIWGKSEKKDYLQTVTSGTNLQNHLKELFKKKGQLPRQQTATRDRFLVGDGEGSTSEGWL